MRYINILLRKYYLDDKIQSFSDKEQKAKDKKKKIVNDKKKKRDVDVEAFEDSDDGDEEGRERDYISDSSER